ncbi:MAG: hypothetical protein K2N25_06535 [Muribaculaceae bacterium]|nr:hypothetical protein [Muribaculaceae bacterium]
MLIRDIVSKVHIPCRPVIYVAGFGGMALMMVATFLPPSLFFLKYVGILLALAGFLYMAFWIYKGGYKKEALLIAILSTAFALITILVLAYYFNLLYGV